jgi:hypothetical protein
MYNNSNQPVARPRAGLVSFHAPTKDPEDDALRLWMACSNGSLEEAVALLDHGDNSP